MMKTNRDWLGSGQVACKDIVDVILPETQFPQREGRIARLKWNLRKFVIEPMHRVEGGSQLLRKIVSVHVVNPLLGLNVVVDVLLGLLQLVLGGAETPSEMPSYSNH